MMKATTLSFQHRSHAQLYAWSNVFEFTFTDYILFFCYRSNVSCCQIRRLLHSKGRNICLHSKYILINDVLCSDTRFIGFHRELNIAQYWIGQESGCLIMYNTIINNKPLKSIEKPTNNYMVDVQQSMNLGVRHWQTWLRNSSFSFDFYLTNISV